MILTLQPNIVWIMINCDIDIIALVHCPDSLKTRKKLWVQHALEAL